MPAQEPAVSKNYIGIVNDTTEEQRVIESLSISAPGRNYLRLLLTRVLKRRGKNA
jgi:hypothetical protein